MAQRATVLVEKAAPAPKRAGRASRASAETSSEPHPIPVDIRKLVAPYKKRGRLIVRVERMPVHARFSAGRNNGDNSWSFTLDELEDLQFLPAPDFDAPVVIAIRIIAHESSSATTVAVLDYEISPEGAAEAAELAEGPTNVTAMEQLRRLRDELAEMASQLGEREASHEAVKAETKDTHVELEHARQVWQAEMDARLAAAQKEAAAEIARKQEAWKKELDTRLAAAEEHAGTQSAEARMRALREAEDARAKADRLGNDVESLRKALAGREAELGQLRANMQGAEATTHNAVRKAIATAETLWKAGEAARLAAAEAQWREQYEQALAEARAAAKKSTKAERGESVRLHGELAVLRTQLSERDAELAKLRANVTAVQANAESAVDSALNRAKELWKAEEAARLAAVEERWREQSERALIQARAAAKHAEDPAETTRMRADLANARKELGERTTELAQMQSALVQSRAQLDGAVKAALSKAEEKWKADEAARLAAAQAQWREQSEHAIANAGKTADERQSELERQLKQAEELRHYLARRDSEIEQLRATLASAEPKTEQAVREALANAEQSWKAAEAARLAEAEAQWRAQSEQVLAQAREEAAKAVSGERERQSGEVSDLRKQLGARDGEIAQLQTALAQAGVQRERDLTDAQETWKAGEAARLASAEAQWQGQSAAMKAELQSEHARIKAEAQANSANLSSQHASELQAARTEIANYREMLTAREGELAQTRNAITATEKRAESDIDAARAAAEREARERFQAKLAEATARYEAAESALVEMRMRTGNQTTEDASRLLDEINTLRTVLANRESELAQFRHVETDAPSQELEPISFVEQYRGLIVPALIALSIVMGGVLLWPQIVSALPYDWQLKIYEMNGQIQRDDTPAPAAAPKPAAPTLPQATVLRGVNLRADASTKSNVILTLVPGTNVDELETRGSWTRVRASDAKLQPHEGWVFSTYLKVKSGK